MRLTEEEYKKKCCPQVGFKENCRASLCPWWRWGDWIYRAQEGRIMCGEGEIKEEHKKGYCGLAGKP